MKQKTNRKDSIHAKKTKKIKTADMPSNYVGELIQDAK
jgi:hypothetical protein